MWGWGWGGSGPGSWSSQPFQPSPPLLPVVNHSDVQSHGGSGSPAKTQGVHHRLRESITGYLLSWFPFQKPPSHPPSPCFYEGAPQPTHLLPPPSLGILLHWGIKPSQNHGSVLPLMPDKAILCYICGCSHGFLHVYSLVGGLVPGSSRR